jgi:crotonobetaine/carnitine-CoA ligase
VGIGAERLAPNAVRKYAALTPDRVATREVGGDHLTYAQLDVRGRTWVSAYRRIGVQRDDHVATMLPNGHIAHAAWLGLGWLGAREVPLNAALVGSLLHDALLRSDATVLVVADMFVDRVRELDPLPRLRAIVVIPTTTDGAAAARTGLDRFGEVHTLDEFLAGVEPADDVEGPVYRDIAVVLFTSGTTGPSKPVLVPWANIYQFWSVPDDTLLEGESVYARRWRTTPAARASTTRWPTGARSCSASDSAAPHCGMTSAPMAAWPPRWSDR